MVLTCRISSLKLTCFILMVATAGSIVLCLLHIMAVGHQKSSGFGSKSQRIQEQGSIADISQLDLKWAPYLKGQKFKTLKQKVNYIRWKSRLKAKWEHHKKLMQYEIDSQINGSSFKKYVDLSPVPLWDLDSLWEYFTDTPTCKCNPLLLILVTSAPANFDRRLAIRKAWALNPVERCTNFRAIFLIGKAPTEFLDVLVDNEIDRHGDILRGSYSDSYRNLTLKVLHGLTYANRVCEPKYVLKTDDDCFVNVPLILDFLKHHNTQRNLLYVGQVLSQIRTKVIRNPSNKWHVAQDLYSPEFYPPYPSGHGYIISGDLLNTLLSASEKLKPFPNEDAYVGVLMNSIGIRPINTFRFTLFSFSWRTCNLLYLMVIHHVDPEEQSYLLNMSLAAKQKCPGQSEVTTW